MKEYFSHDFGARNDPKLVEVMMQLGHEGKSVYWDLIEMLYEQGGYLMHSQCKGYAFALRTECALIQSLVSDFGLFVSDEQRFWSESVLRRLELRRSKSAKASESASKRWAKSEGNANGMRTHSEGNAIKEKESKEKTACQQSGGEQAGGQVSASPSTSPAKHEVKAQGGAAPKPREYAYDEAPIFQQAAFFTYLQEIGYGHVDRGLYLLQIQAKGREKMILTTDEKWKGFILTFLNNDRRDNKLLLPEGGPQVTTHRNPYNATLPTPKTTGYVLADKVKAQTTKNYI